MRKEVSKSANYAFWAFKVQTTSQRNEVWSVIDHKGATRASSGAPIVEVHIAQFVAIDNINARGSSLLPTPTTIIIILSPTTNEVEVTYYVSSIIVPIIMNLFCLIL